MRLFLGELDTTEHPSFTSLEGVRVAPHVLIDRNGEVTQLVAFDHRAWHAGVSEWQQRSGVNTYSIGIELEGSVSTRFTNLQYRKLKIVLTALFERYPTLSIDRLVGHQEIAPNRKQDPGPFFDWAGLFKQLAS